MWPRSFFSGVRTSGAVVPHPVQRHAERAWGACSPCEFWDTVMVLCGLFWVPPAASTAGGIVVSGALALPSVDRLKRPSEPPGTSDRCRKLACPNRSPQARRIERHQTGAPLPRTHWVHQSGPVKVSYCKADRVHAAQVNHPHVPRRQGSAAGHAAAVARRLTHGWGVAAACAAAQARTSATRHAVTRSDNLTGNGNVPALTLRHSVAALMGTWLSKSGF